MFVNVFAALGLLVCILLAIDMALPRRHQMAIRAWMRRPRHLSSGPGLRSRFNSRERRRAAHDAALDAIARAKHRSDNWDGNVYHGDEFEQRRKPH
ncbi:hypothetical protein CDN99_19770 [Roseateles aquatilis]|uniref:Uncharacterized protein n=1 Tax=Roseateles aquatilis TaxID=431061 RepID=A0A246J3B5_9BURK|nr:hypothetical protein [Roseateles aquatilis]OWQ86942.1 hypothetical protein CDN99_19770 [Roseateles aquatilis]